MSVDVRSRGGAGMVLALVLTTGAAQAGGREVVMDSGRLADALDRLSNATRVLYVAAHPDDENTRLLSYFVNGRKVTAAYLSLTRGGGGQNLIGTEQGELLDMIRTEELLAARRIDGALQWFSQARDFGFSKGPEETLAIWNQDAVLSDVVRVIRRFQPDVIITRFNEDRPNHGHHIASSVLAREAFFAAADPTRFPDQLEQGLTPWKATRLVHNVSHWRGPPPPEAFPIDIGGWSPRLGLGYGEIAALSRSEHKSQGFGASGERGEIIENFTLIAGDEVTGDLLARIPPGWTRYGERAQGWTQALDEARKSLDRDHPERALPLLARAYRALDDLPVDVRTRDARQELERLLLSASGLFLRATATQAAAVPESDVEVSVEVVLQRPADVRLGRVVVGGVSIPFSEESPPIVVDTETSNSPTRSARARRTQSSAAMDEKSSIPATSEGTGEPKALEPNRKVIVTRTVAIPRNAPVTLPYWLDGEVTPGRFPAPDPNLVGLPHGPPALVAKVDVVVEGIGFTADLPVIHTWTDRVHGERIRPFLVVPPATVTPLREATMVVNGGRTEVLIRVRAHESGVVGDVSFDVPNGWSIEPSSHRVELATAGSETTVRFKVGAPSATHPPVEVIPVVTVDGRRWAFREDFIDYSHIPVHTLLRPASLRLSPVALSVPKGLVGYVHGPGDTVADDLAHVGVRVEAVDDDTLRAGDFSRYSAIVVGIRAYNTKATLRAAHDRLMRWVETGGTVVVQYNTHTFWDPLPGPIGPYPLELGRLARITDETAEMVPVTATHPLLTTPHRLGAADFAGWVQERGIYFATEWDERYEPLFRIADPGEEPMLGGTLVARHGKGQYVYTGLSFFRQLPAGIPGAYRLLINFLGGTE